MRRYLLSLSAAAIVCGIIATPSASAQQSLNLFVGGFTPRPLDARECTNLASGNCDVLVENSTFLSTFNRNNGIDISRFNGGTVGGEYLVGLGRHVEAGLGLGFYQKSVTTSYTDFVNTDGTEIAQTLKFRVVPFTATFKLLPFGTDNPIQPYIGAGVGIFGYRYSETGQFIDFSDPNLPTNPGNFVGSGAAAGPVVLGGVRAPTPFGTIGGEIRYQSAVATLPSDKGFAGEKIDLGGWNYLFTISFKL